MSQRDRVQLHDMQEDAASKRTNENADQAAEHAVPGGQNGPTHSVLQMQRTYGNQAVQRMLGIQRSVYEEGGPLNSEISGAINSKRGSGSSLDGNVQAQMGEAMGHDFSGVNVHTDAESDSLNKSIGAKAFTTGNDIFFSEGSYQPGTSAGNELLAHELTHVVQQSGSSPSGDLTLGPASDSYESEADSVASSVTTGAPATAQAKLEDGVQRQEEEEVMAKRDADVQRQEEEEMVQPKRDADIQRQEEEEVMAKRDSDVQRQEEEEVMAKRDADVQRQEEEEEMVQPKRDADIQRQEEEEVMAKRDADVQRQEEEEAMQL